tara:strand:- start:25270 stop:25419 length:150 start_codon:yes stop_codon:yes gene_type:complete
MVLSDTIPFGSQSVLVSNTGIECLKLGRRDILCPVKNLSATKEAEVRGV